MSGAENLSYAARFYGMTPHQTRTAIPEILERVGFPPDGRGEAMENLSRGMQQKVALARALLTSPVLLLLDEPTTGLDPRSKIEGQEFLRNVRAAHAAPILLCPHDIAPGRERPGPGWSSRPLPARLPGAGRGREAALQGRDARGSVFRRHRTRVRSGGERRRRRVQGGVRMSEFALETRNQLVGLFGIVGRNMS